MNKYLDLLTNKIYDLYRAYEDHAFNAYINGKNNRRLIVNFKNNNTIHFALFERNQKKEFELVDEVYIGFDDERDLYEVIALNVFIKALGNVMVYKLSNNSYYNPKHKPYIYIISEDQEINDYINKIIKNQAEKLDTKIIDDISKKVKRKKIEWSFLSMIEDRTELTRELFRKW